MEMQSGFFKKKSMEKIVSYINSKIKYCEDRQEQYPVSKYCKPGRMTDEQMSGYYQGMGAWLRAVLDQIEDEAVLQQVNPIPTDEEIERVAKTYEGPLSSMAESIWKPEGFKEGAKWMREKLTGKLTGNEEK